MKITACIICKNEESCIEKCLDSLSWIDEICVVDTWSTDNTIELAKKYTEKVHSFHWIDDFSKARNYAKSLASNEWILSLDCDEVLQTPIEDIKWIIENNSRADWFMVELYNEVSGSNKVCRIFKKELNWEWAIHETITPTNPLETDIKIKFWFSESHKQDPYRNLRILNNEYKLNPTQRTRYYIARELIMFDKWKEALSMLQEYMKEAVNDELTTDALFMMWIVFYRLEMLSEASEALIESLKLNPQFKACYELMALIDKNQFKQWIEASRTATNEWLLFIHNDITKYIW